MKGTGGKAKRNAEVFYAHANGKSYPFAGNAYIQYTFHNAPG